MSADSDEQNPAARIAGCDLGKASASFVVGRLGPSGALEIEESLVVPHEGRPMQVFREWYERAQIWKCAALGATGLHADELVAPVTAGLPEDACLQAALRTVDERTGPINIVRIGARGYAVLTRGADGRFQFLENDKCSSGTGETMVKIAGRFGLSIEEADQLAIAATESTPITARCSVFAKSEMTHFGNQGRSADGLFRGYFASVANYVAALLARTRVDGPVLAIGGCAQIRSLMDALAESLGQPVEVLPHAQHMEAIGAAALAAETRGGAGASRLPRHPEDLIRPREQRFRGCGAARDFKDRVQHLESPPIPPGSEREPAVLGLDLGSTGAKAVLTSVETGEAVLDVYVRTHGNPVAASRRLLETLLEKTDPDVRAIALTGSGREAAATVLRAAYPDLNDRIVVRNEIVAHATAAIRCDDQDGRSLSVVEIGGQDAKFIQIAGGQIVESDMNKACSAGTGSFLEEQGAFFGIDDIEEFTRLAQEATAPPELGQMCTVHVADAAAEASNEGFGVADLLGGFQYSVIQNYMNRVMGQRTFGERIFFQGKPATGPALGWTLAAVSGREVIVPPNPGAMGAWGAGLCALEVLDPSSWDEAPKFDLRSALAAKIVESSEFQCRDRSCATLCSIEKTIVEVGQQRSTVYSGGACPKYEISSAAKPKLPREAPSAFDERTALLAPYVARSGDEGGRVVGIPLVGACTGVFPWLVTFVRELGFVVQPLIADSKALSRGEGRCYSYDACAPVKIAHGTVNGDLDGDVDTVFFPKILSLAQPEEGDSGAGRTCVLEQGLPEMVRESMRARGQDVTVVHPMLSFAKGFDSRSLLKEAWTAAGRLGAPRHRVFSALRRAAEAQRQYDTELLAIGRRTLAYAEQEQLPVVAVCGNLHVIHDATVNAGIPRLLRDNGVLALPMDCFPIPEDVHPMPRLFWAESARELRVAAAARARGGVYPLLLSSFGCGPNSFSEQIFSKLMEGYPHTSLESDGHGGTAGYVTRVQAFLHTVRQHDGRADPVPEKSLRLLEPLPEQSMQDAKQDSRLLMLPVGDRLSQFYAAALRSDGFDAVATGPSRSDAMALGRRDCSGKECLPYQNIWGSFRTHIEENPTEKQTLLMQTGGEGMCRFCLFSIKDQITLERHGLEDRVAVANLERSGGGIKAGIAGFKRSWFSTVTWDLLNQLLGYYRPLETTPGEADRLYTLYCDEAEAMIETPPRLADGEVDIVSAQRGFIDLVGRASRAYFELAADAPIDPSRRTVLLSGDFYVRLDRMLSDDIVRRLNERGLHVITEPMNSMQEYMAAERLTDLFGIPNQRLPNIMIRRLMTSIRREFYAEVQALNPWLPMSGMKPILAASQEVLESRPHGQARKSLGTVLHYWREGVCDGVIVISPWGCDQALLSESLLRHQTEIPMLHVYVDGTPVDERRLNAFAFRLRRDPARVPPAQIGPGGRMLEESNLADLQ